MLGDWDKVAIIEGSISPKSVCNVKSCKSKAKFMVFNDDGAPKMSRLLFCCCSKHLSIGIRKGWAENHERRAKLDKKLEATAKDKARKLLGIS